MGLWMSTHLLQLTMSEVGSHEAKYAVKIPFPCNSVIASDFIYKAKPTAIQTTAITTITTLGRTAIWVNHGKSEKKTAYACTWSK